MNQNRRFILYIVLFIGAIVFLSFLVFSGRDSKQTVLIIAPEITGCVGEGIRHCMQIKYDATDPDWILYPNIIEGFEFEPGFQYELLVEEVERGEKMDTGHPYYTLIELISKDPVQ